MISDNKSIQKRRCFIISPIGQESSPERKHANDVLDYIIRPALDACGVELSRSDHVHQPGKISDQIFDAIFHYDMCISLLAFKNPKPFFY